jgi:hypothetical protein
LLERDICRMIRINNLKISPKADDKELARLVASKLRVDVDEIVEINRVKRSLDARKHPDIVYVYSLDVALKGKEEKLVAKLHNPNIVISHDESYHFPYSRDDLAGKTNGTGSMRPVVVGFGPAGMFAALMLAECGLDPIVLERGQSVERRQESVDKFWLGGGLDTESNVQFGEGGAGTFSDGKLNTTVKDKCNRIGYVLKKFIEAGAPAEIEYVNKPHMGTDVLCDVVRNIRERIISLGGEIRFNTRLDDLCVENGQLVGVVASNGGHSHKIDTRNLVLAIGHSARDTFAMLKGYVDMTAKSFAVGVRIQHPQDMINVNAYGAGYGDYPYALPAADYKLTYQTQGGRGVYSFCMCPGGYVVNASSENGMLAVNGMSYSGRDGINANSALIVTVSPRDYANMDVDSVGGGVAQDVDPMAGVEFQRRLEACAYRAGGGRVPLQLLADFKRNVPSVGGGRVAPAVRGEYAWGNVRGALPDFIGESIAEGMPEFDRHIKGYDMEDAIIAGVESRTSSPVRITRDNETMQSKILGIYPCGEGAGYAGGITSAALDGIKVAEKLVDSILRI